MVEARWSRKYSSGGERQSTWNSREAFFGMFGDKTTVCEPTIQRGKKAYDGSTTGKVKIENWGYTNRQPSKQAHETQDSQHNMIKTDRDIQRRCLLLTCQSHRVWGWPSQDPPVGSGAWCLCDTRPGNGYKPDCGTAGTCTPEGGQRGSAWRSTVFNNSNRIRQIFHYIL